MALCGTGLSDEKKDADVDDEHSLDNIVAFSTTKKQMCTPTKEGLITSDENGTAIDRRIKVCYDHEIYCTASYTSLCQLTTRVKAGKAVGSGSYNYMTRGKTFVWCITCAHNLASWSSLRKQAVPFTHLKIYGSREGEKKWYFLSRGNQKTIVHPNFNGLPYCGYDLGIIILRNLPNIEKLNRPKFEPKRDYKIHWMNPEDEIKGMTVELVGYPGEKKGHPFTHTGKILDVVKSDLGGWVLWYNADATPGNSGSAIYLTDEKYIKKHCKSGITKLLIGVHTGHDEAEEKNFGTLLTKSLARWLGKELMAFSKLCN